MAKREKKSSKKKSPKKKRRRAGRDSKPAEGWVPPEELAKILKVPIESIRSHVEQGLPVDDKGRVHLVRYAAWLNLQEARGNK